MTDRLSLADAKIERSGAERIPTEICEAIHDSVATKAHVAAVQTEMQRIEQQLDARIDSLRRDMRLGLAELEHRLSVRSPASWSC